MPKIESQKAQARKPATVRASVHELVEGIALRLDDALKSLRVSGDNGAELDSLLDDLKKHSGGLAEAVIHGTIADDRSPSAIEPPKSNPAASTTVGGTLVNTDLSRVAEEGEAAFKAADGTVARYPQNTD